MQARIYYGEETRKALSNFGPGKTPLELIRAYAKVKIAAVSAVQEIEGRFETGLFACLLDALREIVEGRHDGQFPLSIRQGGAGTSFNMNLNEVATARARELFLERQGIEAPPLDPIEDVNRAQSTNDTFPTAVTVAVLELVLGLEDRVVALQEALVAKEREFDGILVAGRTELQDALPIRLGQVFGAWAGCVERDRWRLHKVKERLRTSALGGTAIGTCFAASPEYVHAAERELRRVTGLPLSRSQNLPDEIAHQDKLAEVADAIGLCAGNLRKICSDLLLYTSSLSGELVHPELQYGSTIMPAKTNPVLLEYARGHAMAAEHEASAARDFAFEGQLQLNAYLPFLADELLDAGRSLGKALDCLAKKFLPLVELRRERIAERLVGSPVLLNLLAPVLGYRKVKELARGLADLSARSRAQGDGASDGGKDADGGTSDGRSAQGGSAQVGAERILDDFIDRVAKASGLPREDIAERFDPHRATTMTSPRKDIPPS